MARLPVRLYGDPVLRRKAREIEELDEDLQKLAEDMVETMLDADGVGLAANQVGDLRRVIVVNITDTDNEGDESTEVLINPEVVRREGSMRLVEGCLSLPEINEEVERNESVTVEYTTLEGDRTEVEASGLHSAVLQHEIDHLDGILIIDRISPVRRMLLKGALKQIARNSKQLV